MPAQDAGVKKEFHSLLEKAETVEGSELEAVCEQLQQTVGDLHPADAVLSQAGVQLLAIASALIA